MTAFTRRAGLGALIGLAATRAQAQGHAHGPIQAEAGWSRAAGAGRVGAGFLTLRNSGAADRLVAARADIARTVELHTHIRDGNVMRMRPVEAIDLPAGETVTLAPGGLHIMLIDLKQALRQGESVPVTLVFEKAGEIQVTLEVQSAGSRGPAAVGGSHRH
ncbi:MULTISPECIES: copper chaperone PCu(A)C [Roseomonadaceae]|uniref:Copper chaperone PCu(A)C n=1 Tax=Falsiroseomonas oleicola TaxID=2801474 RepID=A0ABS6H6X8_9PROT|nr:copper chaperone PCu(A)C [Roseomonas oleicola]MBU8543582.1 copper chaperone PCu(A)C [Roseomonas oleicola]